jgi:phosphomannomutase
MCEVGEFEAKNKLCQVLDLLEEGEKVTITRHGKGVVTSMISCGGVNFTRKMKFVAACGNGTAGAFALRLLERLGCWSGSAARWSRSTSNSTTPFHAIIPTPKTSKCCTP